ncbi:MAG: GPR endopeptidase, partial [Clostridia bacterium]|nr:GPR endopeptidase [Clostridia bacterium]
MALRTDLAVDVNIEDLSGLKGFKKQEKKVGEVTVTKINIFDGETAQKIGKPVGNYITVEFPEIDKIKDNKIIEKEIKNSLFSLVGEKKNNILVIALGNDEITSDNIGPATAKRLLATRHIAGSFAKQIGLKGLKSVAVITPSVLGKTGIETSEFCESIVKKIEPEAVVVIDACVSSSTRRIYRTVQMSDTGINPGWGVKNNRKEISQKTLGVPVVAIGVPTVVEALSLAFELTQKEPVMNSNLIVTPKECDLYTHRISEILSRAVNMFLQP